MPRYLYASPDYLRDAPSFQHPRDLVDHSLFVAGPLGLQDEARHIFYRGLEVCEVAVPIPFSVNSVAFTRSLACLGMGIVALDAPLASADVEAGRLEPVLPAWYLSPATVHAVTSTRFLPARARLFIDFIKARMSAPRPWRQFVKDCLAGNS